MSDFDDVIWQSAACVTRHEGNPILKPADAPYPCSLLFNAGVAKFGGKYVMVFRNDFGLEGEGKVHRTNLGLATSDDGVSWTVQPKPCWQREQAVEAIRRVSPGQEPGEVFRAYDPRLTVIDGRCYMCFACGTRHGERAGLAVTDDFENFEVLTLTVPDNRNTVLFPEKIGGRYVRLERPFPVYGRGQPEAFDTWISYSPDLRYWGDSDLLLGVEDVPFSNRKIGPGAPPVRTKAGWLTTFHAVDFDESRGKNGWEASWKKRYTMGLMLLDLEDPRKIVALSRRPLMVPEAPYETDGGFRNDVLFPGGMILEDDGLVRIYYGAADTVECLATAHVDDLIAFCRQG